MRMEGQVDLLDELSSSIGCGRLAKLYKVSYTRCYHRLRLRQALAIQDCGTFK